MADHYHAFDQSPPPQYNPHAYPPPQQPQYAQQQMYGQQQPQQYYGQQPQQPYAQPPMYAQQQQGQVYPPLQQQGYPPEGQYGAAGPTAYNPAYAQQQQQQPANYAYQPNQSYGSGAVHMKGDPNVVAVGGGVPAPSGPQQQHQSGPQPDSPPPNECRDTIWSVIFVLHIIAMITLMGIFINKYASKLSGGGSGDSDFNMRLDQKALHIVLVILAVATVMSLIWLALFKRFAHALIWVCLLLTPVLFTILGFVVFSYLVGLAVMLWIFAAINFLFVFLVRKRIPFSAAILSIVVQVLDQFPATTFVAFVGLLFQIIWMAIWIVTTAGSMYALDVGKSSSATQESNNNSSVVYVVWFFLLVSFYWTCQVLKNVCHVTVAGVLGAWYFWSPDRMPPNPTKGAFKRATWSSFGSICLGSLLVALIKAFRTMVDSATRSEHPGVRCIVLCLVDLLERAMEYFNTYAFTHVALYGKPYCAAAKDTWKLLTTAGLHAIINDQLIGPVLVMSSIGTGLVAAGFAGLMAHESTSQRGIWALWALIGFLVALGIGIVVMEVVSSAVVAFFVCYAEDPAVLQATKPDIYNHIQEAFQGHKAACPPRVQNARRRRG